MALASGPALLPQSDAAVTPPSGTSETAVTPPQPMTSVQPTASAPAGTRRATSSALLPTATAPVAPPAPAALGPAETVTPMAAPTVSAPTTDPAPITASVSPTTSEARTTLVTRGDHDLSIDWSRSWVDSRNGNGHQSRKASAWLRRFLLELAEDDPNRGMEVVMAGHGTAEEGISENAGRGSRRNR
jgi:hypothetical protein